MQTLTEAPLTEEQAAQYRRDGYLIVPNLLSDDELRAYVEHFSKPRPPEWNLGLRTHTADPMFRYVAHHPKAVAIARQLSGGPVRIVQTMALDKAPAGGIGIALHQDTHYLPSEPNTLMACWIAITDTDGDNGGLCVVPGSHKGPLRSAQKAKDDKQHVSWTLEYDMRDRNGREWKEKMYSFEISDLRDDEIARLNVPRGSAVFFTGMTIHGSFANKSPDRPRRAFATHYIREGTWLIRRDVQETVPAGE
jgi:ectoine hydroxylase-related dioxygenase (phytanoyl-CoA dioxygenase family)